MQQETPAYAGPAPPVEGAEGSAGAERKDGPSLQSLIAQLVEDGLDLLALEGRALALTFAMLMFLSVAAAVFALFAWFGLSAIAVVALVNAGVSVLLSVSALAGINAALAVVSGLLVKRLAKSILNRESKRPKEE
jgi:hypothetical protein